MKIQDNRCFRIIGNDNLFKIVNCKGFYLEDYDESNDWHSDPTIIEKLDSGEYRFENY